MARRSFMDLLVIPWVDKTIAIVATVPFVVELYRRWVVGHVNFPRAVLGLQLLVIIIIGLVSNGETEDARRVKILADAYIDASPQDGVLRFGLTFLGIPEQVHQEIIDRWKRAGSASVRTFAPYFTHILDVDLFFSLAVASDQISRVRPKGKADICHSHLFSSADQFRTTDMGRVPASFTGVMIRNRWPSRLTS